MAIRSETELYGPVKHFWEQRGYEVKGEVKHCDLLAMKGDGPPIIVELKKSLTVPLLLQGIDRLKLTGLVYLAVELPAHGKAPYQAKWSEIRDLCGRLGLGLLTVRFYKKKKPVVGIVCEPESYKPRHSKGKLNRLTKEFRDRLGDFNQGGSTKQKLVTAYRQKALVCAFHLQSVEKMSPRELKVLSGYAETQRILQNNHYGWFERVGRGAYRLSPDGKKALVEYAPLLECLGLLRGEEGMSSLDHS